jgi:hypothetical protein
MAQCGHCGTTILFGGVRDGALRFCNEKCRQNGYVLSVAQHVPPDILQEQVRQVHQGACPRCGGRGPVDVHKIHRIWSALVLTSWNSSQQLSCRSCGVKGQVGGALFSLVLGWWGFPWGLVLTPVQITRDIVGMCGGPSPGRPSPDLEKLVKVQLAVRAIDAAQRNRQASPPSLPPR